MIIINKEKPNVELEFGKGDICIAPGYVESIEDSKDGFVGFKNQTPREIMRGNTDLEGDTHEFDEFSVTMKFSKVESIDMLIGALECAKEYMLGGEKHE